jgi:hypothetical protein
MASLYGPAGRLTAKNGGFRPGQNAKYEIFNEPHGYSLGCNSPPCGTQKSYIKDMHAIIAGAKLPEDRCILDALGWAQDAQGLAKLLDGAIGYHFYSWWLPANATRGEFSALFLLQLRGVANRTYVTEFGGSLDSPKLNYEQSTKTDNNVNIVQGMNDAVSTLRGRGQGILGAFHWHGWENGDSFSYFNPKNANGTAGIHRVLQSCCGT